MSEKQGCAIENMTSPAQKAWHDWHESAGFDPDDDDDYIPEMPPLWRIAFSAGAQWALEQVEAE